jgi:hypothetical protein
MKWIAVLLSQARARIIQTIPATRKPKIVCDNINYYRDTTITTKPESNEFIINYNCVITIAATYHDFFNVFRDRDDAAGNGVIVRGFPSAETNNTAPGSKSSTRIYYGAA